MKVIVLVSGGMDSVTALHAAVCEHEVVAGLSFDYGSKHNHQEIASALGIARGSVKVLLSRARAKLRKLLVTKGLTARA